MGNSNRILDRISVILVQPQMGENIGAAARIMSNFGLSDLRIVAPRDGWPNPKALETARNAAFIIEAARIYPSLREAAADLQHLFASTARPREMIKPCLAPHDAAEACLALTVEGIKAGLVFGPERSGLTNEDVAYCDTVVTIPVSETHASLNLAQAVAILCYECFALQAGKSSNIGTGEVPLATRAEVTGFFDHLETALDRADYFKVPEKRGRMLINIQNMFLRARLTDQDVRTLRGILTSLEKR